MNGKRVADNAWTTGGQHQEAQPGDYCKITEYAVGVPCKAPGGVEWWLLTPNGHHGRLVSHTVEEHEDGTITVSPSILVSNPQQGELYHGWLKRGVWTP